MCSAHSVTHVRCLYPNSTAPGMGRKAESAPKPINRGPPTSRPSLLQRLEDLRLVDGVAARLHENVGQPCARTMDDPPGSRGRLPPSCITRLYMFESLNL